MKRTLKLAITATICLALCAQGGALCAKRADAEATGEESGTAEQRTELLLPGSYEQYLPLTSPSDVAIDGEHIAVADGKNIYVFDRTKPAAEYRVYTHLPESASPAAVTISKMQFSEEGRLYFVDSAQEFYELDLIALTPSEPLLALSTFCIAEGMLYAVTVVPAQGTSIYQLSMDAPLSIATALHYQALSPSPTTPGMTFGNGILYCTIADSVFSYDGETLTPGERFFLDKESYLETNSICALGDGFFFTDARGLQRADGAGNSAVVYEGSGFTALTSYDGKLYAVKGATVRELALTENGAEYTGYEIASKSDSVNRLSGAGDVVRGGSLTVTADVGNERVTVYDAAADRYTAIDCGTPKCVATDGKTIAVGVGSSVLVYDFEEYLASEEYAPKSYPTQNAVLGVAVVYGRVYYITEHYYGVAEEGGEEFTRSNSPTLLTNDIYGNLYVADRQFMVTRFTEEEFMTRGAAGTVVNGGWLLPPDSHCLRADFEGNIYYLWNGYLYRNGNLLAPPEGSDYVYRGESAEPLVPVSFALSFEDPFITLQYGEFLIGQEYDVPTLSTIPAEDARAEILRVPEGEALSFTEIREGATAILLDLNELTEESSFYPYRSYRRTAGGKGVLLRRTETFSLVALCGEYDCEIGLFLNADCTDEPSEFTPTEAKRYTVSDVALGYYPVLHGALSIGRLDRAVSVTLLGTGKTGYGFDYAYVEATLSGERVRGYVPLSFLSDVSPLPAETDSYRLGYLKASANGVSFRSEDGERITVTDRIRVKIYDGEDGLCTVGYTAENGKFYRAQVTADMLEAGSSDALRSGLIIVLSVIAVGIVAAYVLLVPHNKKS